MPALARLRVPRPDMAPKDGAVILPHGERLLGPQNPEQLDLLSYLPLAKKFAGKWRHSLGDFDDALQVCFLGLLKARDAWQPSRGPFGAIAAFYIREALKAELYRRERLAGRSPNDTTVGRYRAGRGEPLSAQPQESYSVVSAEQLRAGDGEPVSIIDQIADEAPTAELLIISQEEEAGRKALVAAILAALPPRERRIVESRFMGDDKATLNELSNEFGVSRERIRQIEIGALEKLRIAVDQGPAAILPKPKLPKPARPPAPPRTSASAAGRSWLLAQPHAVIARAMSCLSERQRILITERTLADPPANTNELAASLGVSRESIRMGELVAIDKLRLALGAAPLCKPRQRSRAALRPLPAPNPRQAPPRRRQGGPRPYAWEKDEAGRWQEAGWR